MTLPEGLFYFFSAMALSAALNVIFSKHAVQAVLSLVLTFVSTAALWLIAQAEFLGIILVLVYVGAVMVLFLFVVMMLDLPASSRGSVPTGYRWLALGGAGGLGALLLYFIWQANSDTVFLPEVGEQASNVRDVGYELFTGYLLPFEVAGVILLAAMVAAIVLTFRGRQGMNKYIDPSRQVQVRKQDRLKIVSLARENPPS